jgi:hypothetical protein
MAIGLGHKSYIGFADESTWGTPVARTKFLELVTGGDGLAVKEEKILVQGVKDIGVRGDIEVQQGAVSVEGSLTFEVPYDGAEKFFKHAFGSVASSQPNAGTDPTVWQHIFTIADALPAGMTIEVNRDVTAFVYEGCKVNNMEFSVGGPTELLRIVADILGEDVTTASATSPTFTSVNRFSAPQAVLLWNAVQLNVQQFSIKLDNKLDADRRFLGSRLRSEPLRSGKIEVTGSFVAEFDSTSQYTDFRNGTNRILKVTFTGPSIGVLTQKYTFLLECNVSQIMDYPVSVDDEGRITVEIQFRAFRDASNNELKLTLTNLTASPI